MEHNQNGIIMNNNNGGTFVDVSKLVIPVTSSVSCLIRREQTRALRKCPAVLAFCPLWWNLELSCGEGWDCYIFCGTVELNIVIWYFMVIFTLWV